MPTPAPRYGPSPLLPHLRQFANREWVNLNYTVGMDLGMTPSYTIGTTGTATSVTEGTPLTLDSVRDAMTRHTNEFQVTRLTEEINRMRTQLRRIEAAAELPLRNAAEYRAAIAASGSEHGIGVENRSMTPDQANEEFERERNMPSPSMRSELTDFQRTALQRAGQQVAQRAAQDIARGIDSNPVQDRDWEADTTEPTPTPTFGVTGTVTTGSMSSADVTVSWNGSNVPIDRVEPDTARGPGSYENWAAFRDDARTPSQGVPPPQYDSDEDSDSDAAISRFLRDRVSMLLEDIRRINSHVPPRLLPQLYRTLLRTVEQDALIHRTLPPVVVRDLRRRDLDSARVPRIERNLGRGDLVVTSRLMHMLNITADPGGRNFSMPWTGGRIMQFKKVVADSTMHVTRLRYFGYRYANNNNGIERQHEVVREQVANALGTEVPLGRRPEQSQDTPF